MNDLIDTTEMYLKAIIELEEQSITPRRARIAERLEHSGPTVSQTVARMERDGLVKVKDDRHLELTESGRERATAVMRKHRLAERLLSDVIGLDWELVHEEACRWEHVMSEQVEDRLVEILPDIYYGPYGNAVPGLEALGKESVTPAPVVSLLDCVADGPVQSITLAWYAEPLQVDRHLLGQFRGAGLLPGILVDVEMNDDYVAVRAQGSDDVLDLPAETAAHVFVSL